MFLGELKRPVQELKGVGPAAAGAFAAMHIHSCGELLAHLPRTYEDRMNPVTISSITDHSSCYINAEVVRQEYIGRGPKRTLKVIVSDGTGYAALLCFGRNFLERVLTPGVSFHIFGSFSVHFGELQCSSFESERAQEGHAPKQFGRILPIYPLAAGLTQKSVRKAVNTALQQFGRYLEDELPQQIRTSRKMPSYRDSLLQLHQPESIEEGERAREHLAFSELFYLQLTMLRRNALRRSQTKGSFTLAGSSSREEPASLAARLQSSLPFELTADQCTVLTEIEQDMRRPYPMNRLLQGDVGSGKTLTGFISLLPVIESGAQAAFMAPTELLAKQHAENAARLLEPLGVRLALLTGSVPAKQRQLLTEALAAGTIDLIIGTHALFSSDVCFSNLEYVIIDEQQRFGVQQRLSLVNKGTAPHQLLMTATPIPRTLALSVFGDLDISTIRTMPEGRKPVVTHLAAENSRERVYRAVDVEFSRGHQAYFVYPKIESSGNSSLRDVLSMYRYLAEQQYPDRKGELIHSKVAEDEKVSIMHRFREGELDFLVSTSVVEVGVDVPNATCMVIEHAERFGLSALHQLRGRVGRGEAQSYAFLIFSEGLPEDGKKRLKVMRSTHDGFEIAEQDLLIRGPGELSGRRQSGYLSLRFSDIVEDLQLMRQAQEIAREIITEDPALIKAEHEVIRTLLMRSPPFEDTFIE